VQWPCAKLLVIPFLSNESLSAPGKVMVKPSVSGVSSILHDDVYDTDDDISIQEEKHIA